MKNILEINLAIYRVHVLVAWEVDIRDALKYAKKLGCDITEEEMNAAKKETEERISGLAVRLGERNTDLLVWLKEKPVALKSHGTLWHELHHAVYMLAEDRSMQKEMEAQAYIYEYLTLECCKYFWTKPKKPLKKRSKRVK